jgi:hypothetical protein
VSANAAAGQSRRADAPLGSVGVRIARLVFGGPRSVRPVVARIPTLWLFERPCSAPASAPARRPALAAGPRKGREQRAHAGLRRELRGGELAMAGPVMVLLVHGQAAFVAGSYTKI